MPPLGMGHYPQFRGRVLARKRPADGRCPVSTPAVPTEAAELREIIDRPARRSPDWRVARGGGVVLPVGPRTASAPPGARLPHLRLDRSAAAARPPTTLADHQRISVCGPGTAPGSYTRRPRPFRQNPRKENRQ